MIKETFICDESHLREMISFIKQQLKTKNVAAKKIKKIHVIAEEVLTNIIEYAYAKGINSTPDKNKHLQQDFSSPKTITIKLEVTEERNFVCKFMDNGKAFDFYDLQKKSSPMKKPQIGGLGIYIITKLADSIDYNRLNNKNILTVFVKDV